MNFNRLKSQNNEEDKGQAITLNLKRKLNTCPSPQAETSPKDLLGPSPQAETSPKDLLEPSNTRRSKRLLDQSETNNDGEDFEKILNTVLSSTTHVPKKIAVSASKKSKRKNNLISEEDLKALPMEFLSNANESNVPQRTIFDSVDEKQKKEMDLIQQFEWEIENARKEAEAVMESLAIESQNELNTNIFEDQIQAITELQAFKNNLKCKPELGTMKVENNIKTDFDVVRSEFSSVVKSNLNKNREEEVEMKHESESSGSDFLDEDLTRNWRNRNF